MSEVKIARTLPPTTRTVVPYGSWRSPITAELIAAEYLRIGDVRFDRGVAFWLEGRPREKGRNVVVRETSDGTAIDITPPFVENKPYFNVRTHVYEYGGGAWLVDEGVLYFTNFSDGRLYRQDIEGGAPVPLTPGTPSNDKPIRHYADGVIDGARRHWIGIVEDWSKVVAGDDPSRRHPKHRVVAIDLAGDRPNSGAALAEDHDFFSSPRLSPDGERLAWLAWDHPRMPWHGTTLYMVELDGNGKPASRPVSIAGGPEESILQPEWSPSGTELWFISDRSGWWNLYRYDVSRKEVKHLAPMEAEFGQPQWNLGQSSYAFTGDGGIVATYSSDGRDKLGLVDTAGRISQINLPYTTIRSVRTDGASQVGLVGGSPQSPESVTMYELVSGKQRILKKSTELADNPVISQHFTDVESITFPTTHDEVAHGLYYPPANADFTGPANEKPPLVVMSHGGPTAQASSTLNFRIQYWTSRGIAVLDVNYRGSSGFGRAYRDRLRENWGTVDVEDCISGARYLADKGAVDHERTVITGSSAGGYTTLAALTFYDYFRAGGSHYGIGDLETLAKHTHKFESHYLDWLVGPYPDQIERYRERSPIHHVERLSRPVIFFQGEDDQIVPPNQAETMVEAIKRRNLSVGYLLFAGEQHGFRSADNIRRAIEAEHYFFTFEAFRSRLSFGEPAKASHP